MSKLFKLKEWLTLSDAARHLSIAFGEEVSEADVLRLALDGHLKLSVNFVNFAAAKRCNVVPFSEAIIVPLISFEGEASYKVCLNQPLNDHEVLQIEEEIVQIEGVWDLLMVGGERLDVEHKYQQLTGGVDVALVHMAGTFVKGANGQICQIQAIDDDYEDPENKIRPWNHSAKYWCAEGLPKNSVLVVRTNALLKLEETINNSSVSAEKPMTTTERNTLLTVVAALCDYSAIAPTERGAAGQIAKLTEEIGVPVTDDTIRKILSKIPDILESRK